MEEATWPQAFPKRDYILYSSSLVTLPLSQTKQNCKPSWELGGGVWFFWDKGKEMLRGEQEGVRNSSCLQMENKPKKLDQKKKGVGGKGCLITKTPF